MAELDLDLVQIHDDGANELPELALPSDAELFLHGAEPPDNHPHVFMSRQALQQVDAHADSNTRVELGGILLGHATQADGQLCVYVEAAIPARSEENGPVHFTFTHDTWDGIHEDRETLYPHLDIVGWFHTHPDLGVFYSTDDEVVHSSSFTQPWHIGLVVDPVRNHASYFGWLGKNVLGALAGFYELHDNNKSSAVDWEIRVDNSWFGPMMGGMSPYPYGADAGAMTANEVTQDLLIGLALFLGGVGAITGILSLIFVLRQMG